MLRTSLLAALGLLSVPLFGVSAQEEVIPSSFPQNYTGIPPGDYSTDWQSYFEVTDPLPGVGIPFSAGRSFAGNVKVNRPGHDNDTLFFWAVERANGSLTVPANASDTDPWVIWLNGGPGASSMIGFFNENGPLQVTNDGTLALNNFSWDGLADMIWVDQPVGVGFATADETGYIMDEDQMGQDFIGFLSNIAKVFPSLANRPLHLTGESYAGTYIPYIVKAIFSDPEPPVRLSKFAIGDGVLDDLATFEQLPVVSVIETYPQIIGFDPDVLQYFREQSHLCGYDLNFTYPQEGLFPTLNDPDVFPPESTTDSAFLLQSGKSIANSRSALLSATKDRFTAREGSFDRKRGFQKREEARMKWKRDLSGRANGTIDPFYGCFLWDEMIDYAANFSFPWTLDVGQSFDPDDVPDALDPLPESNPNGDANALTAFLNDNRTRTALHAPTSKDWAETIQYPFNNTFNSTSPFIDGDTSPPPMRFLTDLARNATLKNVLVVIYSGNDDALVPHRGSEVAIQNTTFGGIQGFTRQPSTPWYDDDGKFAGIVHQERNWTYVLIDGAGHTVPYWQPKAAFVLFREFILGSNTTGLVTDPGVPAIGGEDPNLIQDDVLPGGNAIFYGSSTTMSTLVFPSETYASWSAALASITAT